MEKGEFEAAPKEVKPSQIIRYKTNKSVVFGMLFFMLVAIGLGVWVVILLVNGGQKNNSNSNTSSNSSSAENGGGNTSSSIRNDDMIRQLVKDAAIAWSKSANYSIYSHSYDDKVDLPITEDLFTDADRSYGFVVTTNDANSLNRIKSNISSAEQSLAKVLSDAGLKEGASTDKAVWHNYSNDEVYCYSSFQDPFTTGEYSLHCMDKTWISEEKKNLAIQLGDAYKKKENKSIAYVAADPKDIVKNKAGSYETITAEVFNAAALFYRKVGDTEWKYFVTVQQGPGCSAYNTDELKEAYEGVMCYDNAGKESTVKR